MVFETRVEEVIPRTSEVKSFRFKRPSGFNYLAGQWMYVSIKVEGTQKMHHFTISSSPTEDFLEFTKKIDTGSQYTNTLNSFKGGEWALINGPFGDFTYSDQPIKIGALTGGIGITPLRSICKYCVDKKLTTDVKMLYANHTEKDIVFRDQFEEMQNADPHLKIENVLTREPQWSGLRGHVTAQMIREQMPDYKSRVFYICGPPSMNAAMKKELEALQLSESQIKLEDFTGYK
jgi:ferredoxin-NADP reductase